ncbi:MAG: AraC family ligand binding domain-containing protein [Acutalibacteraceae bacterium]
MLNFQWDNINFTLIQLGKGIIRKDIAGHSHSKDSYEFHYITKGSGTLVTDTKQYKLSKGDFFVTGPNIYHRQLIDKDNPTEEIYVYLQAFGKKTNSALTATFLANHFYFENDSKLYDVLEKILRENDEKKWGYEAYLSALFGQLLTEITRLYRPDFSDVTKVNENLNDRRFLIIENAFIDDSKSLTLTKLSNMIGLCERQTQRLLKKYYGKSFLEKKQEALLHDNKKN